MDITDQFSLDIHINRLHLTCTNCYWVRDLNDNVPLKIIILYAEDHQKICVKEKID